MSSKKLESPFGTVYTKSDPMPSQVSSDETPEGEKALHVEDRAHTEDVADSFETEEKTLDEKEAEHKQKMGLNVSGQSDLEEEREIKRVQLRESLEDDRKLDAERQRLRSRRVKQNVHKVEDASQAQLQRMRSIRAQYRAGSKVLDTPAQRQARVNSYVREQKAVMKGNDSVTNLLSMSINDKLMNAGKERKYAEDYAEEKTGLFGPEKGKQKTILVNGAMVTIDEDVAEAIQERRTPIMSGISKKLNGLQREQDVDKQADAVETDMTEVQDEVAAETKDEEKLEQTEAKAEMEVAGETESVDAPEPEKQSEKRDYGPAVGVFAGGSIAAYLGSHFASLERRLQYDRSQMQDMFIYPEHQVYNPKYVYSYGVDKELSQSGNTRRLPDIAWGQVDMQDTLENGRKLPYIDYSEYRQPEYSYGI